MQSPAVFAERALLARPRAKARGIQPLLRRRSAQMKNFVFHKDTGDRIQGGEGEIASNLNPIRYTLQPALFGIVQGGKFENLRRESAKISAGMDFDGFGIFCTFLK